MPSARRAPLRTALAVVVLVVGLAACSDDGGDAATSPGADGGETSLIPAESNEVAPSSETTVSTAPATTGPTAPTAPAGFTDTARDAVNELRAAWEAGDQARGRAIAPGDVVDALFAVPADGFEVYGCDTGEFATSTCNFRNRATEGFIVVNAIRSDQGWQIDSITVNDD